MSNTATTLLGRLYAPDPRDRDYPVMPQASNEVDQAAFERRWRYWWQDGWWGDQWYTPQCVAYAWVHWLEDGPTTHTPRKPSRKSTFGRGNALLDPATLYTQAQVNDQWSGTDYDGTSVRAGAKVLAKMGLIGTYRWALTIEAVIDTLLLEGPVVAGTHWYGHMSTPDSLGRVRPTGDHQGGHAYVLNGINLRAGDSGLLRIKNSWGRDHYGFNGNAWIEVADFAALLDDQGEVCLATEVEET